MASPDYQKIVFDLTAAHDRQRVVDVGTKINHLAIEAVPLGTTALFHLGNKEGIPIVIGESWDVWADDSQGCPVPHDEGLFISNVAGAGSLQIVVSFGAVGVSR